MVCISAKTAVIRDNSIQYMFPIPLFPIAAILAYLYTGQIAVIGNNGIGITGIQYGLLYQTSVIGNSKKLVSYNGCFV